MTSRLIKSLPLSVFLLSAASGCEFVNFDAPIELAPPPDPGAGLDGAAPPSSAPLYPFQPGSIWQYTVTAPDGGVSRKFVAIDKQTVMVGGNGPHQLDLAYPVRTSGAVGGQAWLVTLQQKVGDQIVNWREESFDQQGQMTLDVNWEPQQLEVDQSSERTRPGASWQENYTEIIRPSGLPPTTIRQSEAWTVVRHEVLSLPGIMTPFQTIVFQKSAVVGGSNDAGTGDAGPRDGGTGTSDAGKSDAGPGRPMLPGESEAVDGGTIFTMPKTLWYARGYGKVKEAGGNQPTEELSGLELK
jgi:hypothetical protein